MWGDGFGLPHVVEGVGNATRPHSGGQHSRTFAVFGPSPSCTHQAGKNGSSECTRVSLCLTLSAACLLLCMCNMVWKVRKHVAKKGLGAVAHQLGLLGLAAFQSLLLVIRFATVVGRDSNVVLDKVVVFINIVIPFGVTYVFLIFSRRVFVSSTTVVLISRCFVVLGLGEIVVLIIALSSVLNHSADCRSLSWTLMSTAGLVSCGVFFGLATVVSRRLARMEQRAKRRDLAETTPLTPGTSTINADGGVARRLRAKRRKLRSLIALYTASAVLAFFWDLYSIGIFGRLPGSCSYWITDSRVYVTVYILRIILTLLVPIVGVNYQFWES
ncbi:uncharacterized protein AMSG_01975 [Thecamonas trahens ATCC 50062]|uniref:Uncharacterized protein n=1 Tax=Thecamonas trahens ATCC 50062 TaxID=461836 RepID=A0A0L0DV45_THETB|nr:hypothetical protein AMSG_01975 [Thecamonas trahens ATCC 50062]KNC55961.1 hypothetical protein AMSG_01975 [Thecamonas trahens ATCC 50062]|eukprot:XP_013761008.1 hypothetical protein AMSG_01975 [Thecamonas trahens ATCC 50062]